MQKHQETQCSFCLKNLPTSSLAKHKAICHKNPEFWFRRCTHISSPESQHIYCYENGLSQVIGFEEAILKVFFSRVLTKVFTYQAWLEQEGESSPEISVSSKKFLIK